MEQTVAAGASDIRSPRRGVTYISILPNRFLVYTRDIQAIKTFGTARGIFTTVKRYSAPVGIAERHLKPEGLILQFITEDEQ